MIIFEDKKTDALSRLFRAAYPEDISDKFIYSKGNGRLEEVVIEHINVLKEDTDALIIVYMDTVPLNKNIVGIYNKLRKLSKENNYRIIILNIVCAEFYFLKAFEEWKELLISDEGMGIALSYGDYRKSNLMLDEQNKKYCKNFERYCKLLLKINYIDCVKHSRGQENDNLQYEDFYTKDCNCNMCDECEYKGKTLLEKSFMLISEYPCFPVGSLNKHVRELNESALWSLHRKLIDNYNDTIRRYCGTNGGSGYFIKYIK